MIRKPLFSAIASVSLTVGAGVVLISTPVHAEAAAEAVIASGTWTKKSFNAQGMWKIIERDGARYVILSEEFSTRSAPDLKIFLSPQSPDELTGKNATDGAVLISPLQSNKGYQEYLVPDGVDVGAYTSVIIHCEQYSKLWSVASL